MHTFVSQQKSKYAVHFQVGLQRNPMYMVPLYAATVDIQLLAATLRIQNR